MAQKTFITIDKSELDKYIANMKRKSYKGLTSDATAIARQSANDIKRAYKPFVPKSERKGQTKIYGFRSGNLQRSLRIFKKKRKQPFVVEFSVGFKEHRYGDLMAKINAGKRANDGWYGSLVDAGVAGRQKGRSNSNRSQGFRGRAKSRVNMVLRNGISQKGMRVLRRRLEKDLLANR